MTPIDFNRIKNKLINDYGISESGRFTCCIATSYDKLWQSIGEPSPVPRRLKISSQQKADIFFERLQRESSPKRFIELCQALADHVTHICYHMPSTERSYPGIFRQDLAGILLGDIQRAFGDTKCSDMLRISSHGEYETPRYDCTYVGSDFGQKESRQLELNSSGSKIVADIIADRNRKPKWRHRLTASVNLGVLQFIKVKFGYEASL